MPTEWPTERIRLDLIDPNPWNPNVVSEENMARLRKAVEDDGLGILGHVVVRPKGKRYELVDGEHRLRIYQEMGMKEVDAIVADLDDENARIAGLILNELRGEPEPIKLGQVMETLAKTRSLESLEAVLPYRKSVLQQLVRRAVRSEAVLPDAPVLELPEDLAELVDLRHGEVREVLASMPDESVQTVVTSPPYWGLRDYSRCECATVAPRREHHNLQNVPRGGHDPMQIEPGEFAQSQPEPDPSCPKCHGTGKDDSLNVVWGGEEDCAHRWGEEVIKHRGIGGPQVPQTKWDTDVGLVTAQRDTVSQFCFLCHAWRGQLGLEPTPELYVQHVVEVFRDVRRVLRDDGTLWLNMGDCYASKPPGTKAIGAEGWKSSGLHDGRISERYAATLDSSVSQRRNTVVGGLKPKDLVGMPWRVAFALQADGWWLRRDIIWAKPNPMPESTRDRPTTAHEYVFLLAKSKDYYYDNEAVREPPSRSTIERWHGEPYTPVQNPGYSGRGSARRDPDQHIGEQNMGVNPGGRNLRDVWTITTQPYPEAHFATFPEKLVEPCVLAGSPEAGVCKTCGAPWERQVELTDDYSDLLMQKAAWVSEEGKPDVQTKRQRKDHPAQVPAKNITTGFNRSCKHKSKAVPAVVLDPFMGSGTTGIVALRHGRRFLGIDVKEEYIDLARRRLAGLQLPAGKDS